MSNVPVTIIVPVYRGRFVAVPRETVLADVAQQIAVGARHVSFGDPDFLNGPTHALRIVRELHARWPEVSFDATIKIEHLLEHRALLADLAQCGMIFVTSAVESLNDDVLKNATKAISIRLLATETKAPPSQPTRIAKITNKGRAIAMATSRGRTR